MGRSAPCDDCRRVEKDGGAKVEVALAVHWGDERGDWEGSKAFCSLKCFSEWAVEKAEDHEHAAA